MGENGDSERQHVDQVVGAERPHLGKFGGDLMDGWRSLRESSGLGRVEHDEGEPAWTSNRLGDRREEVELIARNDEGARLHLKDESDEGETPDAPPSQWELSDTADFPGIERGVLDCLLSGEKHEGPRVTSGRKGFEHMG